MYGFLKRVFGSKKNEVIHAYGMTDIGNRRENNEDFFLIRQERRLFIVADGMGGHNAGEVASTQAVNALDEFFVPEVIARMDNDPSSIESLMIEAFQHASCRVKEVANRYPDYKGMGCTLVMAFMAGDALHTCHVGDVRGFIFSPSTIRQITNDHTEVAKMVREGTMTPEAARTSKLRNYILQAIGQIAVLVPEYNISQLGKDDRVLLCSDGLWNMLPNSRIHEIVAAKIEIDNICQNLIAEAKDAGGHDNITVVVFEKYEKE